jgi:hypothetical protein
MRLKWTWRKGLLLAVIFAIGAVCVWLEVSPAHWLRRVDFGIVKMDEHQVGAEIFFGNPTGEAEAIVLVHLKGGPDYFLNFGTEKVRRGRSSEYLRVPGGAWCFHSMQKGPWTEQLPFRNLNEFRVPTPDGHVVSVQF